LTRDRDDTTVRSARSERAIGETMLGGDSARRRGLVLVVVATILWSTAGFFARLVDHLDVWTMLCWRAFFGGAFLLIAAALEWRRGVLGPYFGLGPLAAPIVALSAVAVTCYIAALKTTTVAEVMVIYATLPFVAAALALVLNKERTNARTLVAAALALVGVLAMVANAMGTGRLVGQALSFLMTLAFGMMIVLQRRYPGMSVTSINAMGAFVAAGVAFRLSPHPAVTFFDLGTLATFGGLTICVAFILFMEGAKHIPAAETGLISMLDVVLGPLWVWLAFGENPGIIAVAGGALVIGALVWRLAPDVARASSGPAID
jgi:drug/metabolite transporter (DMT)-like permease